MSDIKRKLGEEKPRLLTASDKMDALFESTMAEWYEAKHPRRSEEEIGFVNSIAVEECPHCGHRGFKRSGSFADGVVRYRCKGCGRAFAPLTGTLLDSSKIPLSERFEYLIHLMEFHSNDTAARDNRNEESTGQYWLRKVFAALEGCQDGVALSGKVWLDETYFAVMPKDVVRREDGKLLAGISRNKICVATATDGINAVLAVCGKAKPSKKRIMEVFSGHIAEGSTIVHDGENSHRGLIEALSLREERHPTKETKGLPNDENPMDAINSVHRSLKAFMRQHPCYDRGRLGDWLNLFWFIWSTPGKAPEKAKRLLLRMVSTRKIVRFRSVISKNSDGD